MYTYIHRSTHVGPSMNTWTTQRFLILGAIEYSDRHSGGPRNRLHHRWSMVSSRQQRHPQICIGVYTYIPIHLRYETTLRNIYM